jgi:hypothetical protein
VESIYYGNRSMALSLHSYTARFLIISRHRTKDLGPKMLTYSKLPATAYKAALTCVAVLVIAALPARARSLAGTYKCAIVEIAGKTAPCSAPSLELKSDGSYKILSERGTYEVLAGRWLVLSASKNHGKARLDGSKEIVFEFISGGKKSRITYRRNFQRPPGSVAI